MSIRLLLADDHALVRHGLKAFLERHKFQVVCDVSNGKEALRMAAKVRPDVAILDISMPILNGVEAARRLRRSSPGIKVMLLTKHCEDQYIVQALQVGVKGYVLKSQVAGDLVSAIREVCRGRIYVSPAISSAVVDSCLVQATGPTDAPSTRVRTAQSHRAKLVKKA